MVDPYNALLTTHYLTNHTDICAPFDNERLLEINQKWLDRKYPSFENLNRVMNKSIATITAPLRFDPDDDNCINTNLHQYVSNMVPFPRLHFMTTSMSMIYHKYKSTCYRLDLQEITEYCMAASYYNTKLNYFL